MTNGRPYTLEESRAALILAIPVAPEKWIARELAETLARVAFRAGVASTIRRRAAVRPPEVRP